MKTLKEILPYYFNTGLKCTYNLQDVSANYKNELRTQELTVNSFTLFLISDSKPHLRTFDSLTKEITVEGYNGGEPFVPQDILSHLDLEWLITSNNKEELVMTLEFQDVLLLLKWHFNVFNLPTDQFIEIKD